MNSGNIRSSEDNGRSFFRDLVKDKGSSPKVLMCLFAQSREGWESRYTEYVEWLRQHLDGIDFSAELAFPDTFESQCEWADAIYCHGGDDYLCQFWFKQFDLKKLWDGKTVGTNSASSDAVSSSFWTCDWRQCMNGLGLAEVKFIPHYKSEWGTDDPRGPIDWQTAYDELERFGESNLPIHALKEGEYIEIKV